MEPNEIAIIHHLFVRILVGTVIYLVCTATDFEGLFPWSKPIYTAALLLGAWVLIEHMLW